eukprot:171702_1
MSTQPERNSQWNTLQLFPFRFLHKPCMINNHEFMIAAQTNYDGDGIYKFNIHKNQWIKIFNYDDNFKCTIHSTAFDNKNKLLYVSDSSRILVFDLKTNKFSLS